MRTLFRTGFFLGLSLLFFFVGSLKAASAEVYTVCALGCGYTSISDALLVAGTDDTVEVHGDGVTPYDPATETWPLQFRAASTTIACTGGASITQVDPAGSDYINLTTSSTVRDCSLGNVQLTTISSVEGPGQSPAGMQILNNIFSETATSSIAFSDAGATDFLIDHNLNIGSMGFGQNGSTTTRGIISNNTFRNRLLDVGIDQSFDLFHPSASTTNLYIHDNIFDNRLADSGGARNLLSIAGTDIIFATNTVKYTTAVTTATYGASVVWAAGGAHNYIGGNIIEAPTMTPACKGISISSPMGLGITSWEPVIDIYHNTIILDGSSCGSGSGAGITTEFDGGGVTVTATINAFYNLIENKSPTTTYPAGIFIRYSEGSTVDQTNDFNGVHGFSSTVYSAVGSPIDVSGPHSLTADPFLMTRDMSSANDYTPAPFSQYLDINGDEDIGAVSAARRSTIFIDAAGPIDYTIVDTTTTSDIPSFLRTGDTVHIAAGTYRAFGVNSSYATSSIAISGAGVSTIIDAHETENALAFTNVSSTEVSNLWVRNASSTGPASYAVTRINGAIHTALTDISYNEGVPDGHGGYMIPPDATLILPDPACSSPSAVFADGTDITSFTNVGTANFHLALLDIMGSHVTMLLPSDQFVNQAAFEAALADPMGCGIPATVDAFADNVFTVSGGVYTYDAGSLDSAGITLAAGITDPPAITMTPGSHYAGVKLAGSSNHFTVTNVTSTNNGYGVWFATSANGYNTLSGGELASNGLYDVLSASDATNTFDNVSFTRTSSHVTGAGPVLVKLPVRGQTLRFRNGTPVASFTATVTDALGSATVLGAADGLGFSAFSSVPAYKITASSNALTNGGYNPYVFDTGAVAGYNASSTSFTLSSRYQTAQAYLISTSAPAAPSSASVILGVTTSTMEWVDNADDETGFVTNIINLSTGETFPGTTSTATVDATSYDFTGLTPNMTYQARVQATSTSGGSSYLTSSAFTTYAAVPSTPTVAAVSDTSVGVTVNPNGNSTSTVYAVYSSTLGGYLNGAGVVGASPTWQTTSTWATLTISSLTCATSYSFSVIARNLDLVLTATSTAGAVSTSACPVVSSGGGGGGALSTGSGSSLPSTFSFTGPFPTSSSSDAPASTPSVTPPPAPIAPPPVPTSTTPRAIVFVSSPSQVVTGDTLRFGYRYTNLGARTQSVRILRELVDGRGRVVRTSRTSTTLRPASAFSRTVSERTVSPVGDYRVRLRVLDAATSRQIASESFSLRIVRRPPAPRRAVRP